MERGAAGINYNQSNRENEQACGEDGPPAGRIGWNRQCGVKADVAAPIVDIAAPRCESKARVLSAPTRQPFGGSMVTVIDGIENQFYTGGDSRLVENAEKIFFHRVFTEA